MATKRILVIDDEADIREVAQLSLELGGNWDVLVAASGQEGITLAERQQPDAILLDVMMPDMDGPTTWQQLQANPATRHIPVILLTAKVQAPEQRHYAKLGVAAVFAKPFDPVQLPILIAGALHWEL